MRKRIQKLTLGVCYVGMFLLLPMMLLTSADVVGRAFWARPISGAVELSSYMLAVFILLGLAYTQQVKGHVRVEMLVSRLPLKGRLVLELITTLLSMFIIGLLAWQGWVVGIKETSVSDMLRLPQRPFRLLVGVAAFLLFLELLLDLVDTVKRLTKGA